MAGTFEVWRRNDDQLIGAVERKAQQQRVASRVRQGLHREAVIIALVDEGGQWQARRRGFEPVVAMRLRSSQRSWPTR